MATLLGNSRGDFSNWDLEFLTDENSIRVQPICSPQGIQCNTVLPSNPRERISSFDLIGLPTSDRRLIR